MDVGERGLRPGAIWAGSRLVTATIACNAAHMGTWACRAFIIGCLAALPIPAFGDAAPIGATPANDPGLWVTADDYPPLSLRTYEEGNSGFRVSIDAHGAVTNCEIVHTSNSAALDAATCAAVTRRARFHPATDQDGMPVPGSFQSRVNWLIPRTHFQTPTAGLLVRKMIVETDGRITNCGTSPAGGELQFTYEPCPHFYYEPFRDAAGQPMRKLVMLTGTVTMQDVP